MLNFHHAPGTRVAVGVEPPNLCPFTPADGARTILINDVSWDGMLAGVVAGLATQLTLNSIGVDIGASPLNLTASGFSISVGLWRVLSCIIAAFVGGSVARRLSDRPKASTGSWHGLTAWALTTLLIFYLLTTAVGGLIDGAFNMVSAAQTAVQVLSEGTDPVGAMQKALSAPAANDPSTFEDATTALTKAIAIGDDAQVVDAREKVAQALARQQNIPIDQARACVSAYEIQSRDKTVKAKLRAEQAADAAAKTVSRGALPDSLALILGAVAAWFGGKAGTVDPTVTAEFFRTTRLRSRSVE